MAEVKVRGLTKEAVIRLDSFAKERGISRNEFLRIYLENLSFADEMRKFVADYNLTIDKILGVLDVNTKVLKKFCEENLIDINEILEGE
ncbi:hypothetical protein [Clostridium perfringens]|uniref:hypothetical protein n=1 Tax=Clostridium perfringens TaxID=1502 RepID=UPI00077694D3|nr:hypothetical protein [Clostridium perfringens]AMN30799.1 hypothetical protein JFP55_pH0011 [Clostridium perfringens]EIF6165898.1 hypothetical protein [Clostridium perfringens]MDM0935712.1 hypothetical protein [Clostridium perfringens]PWX46978.1 hypothetical protein CYK61_14195 [Clostridium perfringens]HAT4117291.1 hypothetical protein [Clostridium perfringens]